MAIDTPAKRDALMRDYLTTYQRRGYVTIIWLSIITSGAITGILVLCEALSLFSWQFWTAFVMIAATVTLVGMGAFWLLKKPLEEVVRAVIMITGAPTTQTPPNPNATHGANDGFRYILQSLYELANKQQPIIQKIEEPDEALRAGLDQTSSGIVFLDSAQEVIYSNKPAPVNIDSAGDKRINVLFPETDTLAQWVAECQKNTVRADRIWTRVADRHAGEQHRHIYDIVASFNKDSPVETVVTFFDRSSTYAPEEDDLDFISFAAHELRGPITVIRGYLDVIDEELEPLLQNDQKELIQRLIVSSNRLSSYINNILNASRYDRRHFKIHLGEESLYDIYGTIKDDMKLRATSQHRILNVDIPKSLPTIAADKNSIGEVISNLIDNAIKYSNEGGQVLVRARAVSGFIEVSVIDRGIGMPASVIPNLFHKFYRSHRSRETVAGTGIGLYLSKAIVESHGGSIEVRSTESEGSTFTFTLPIYSTVADKIKAGNNSNELLIVHGGGWIRNHSLYRG